MAGSRYATLQFEFNEVNSKARLCKSEIARLTKRAQDAVAGETEPVDDGVVYVMNGPDPIPVVFSEADEKKLEYYTNELPKAEAELERYLTKLEAIPVEAKKEFAKGLSEIKAEVAEMKKHIDKQCREKFLTKEDWKADADLNATKDQKSVSTDYYKVLENFNNSKLKGKYPIADHYLRKMVAIEILEGIVNKLADEKQDLEVVFKEFSDVLKVQNECIQKKYPLVFKPGTEPLSVEMVLSRAEPGSMTDRFRAISSRLGSSTTDSTLKKLNATIKNTNDALEDYRAYQQLSRRDAYQP